jgi:hypothetical protein
VSSYPHTMAKKNEFLAACTDGKNQMARTPNCIFRLIKDVLKQKRWHDPCPENHQIDGLKIDWKRFNYVNPPFRQAKQWILKSIEERNKRGSCTVLLIGARTCTSYFHSMLYLEAHEIIFMLNSLTFKGYATRLGLPIMMAVMGLPPNGLLYPPPLRATSIPCAILSCDPAGWLRRDVVPALRQLYFGNKNKCFGIELLNSTSPHRLEFAAGQSLLVVVMSKPAEHLQAILQKLHGTGFVVVLLPGRYNDSFMRRYVVPHAKHIVFLKPLIIFEKYRAFMSSFCVAFGKPPKLAKTRPCTFLEETNC